MANAKSAIIFIPGYYGTALKDTKTNRRVFLTAREIFFGNESVALYNRELKTPKAPDLVTDGVLEGLAVLPGVYDYNVYGKFIESLRGDHPDQEVIAFGYDWRKDLPEAARALSKLVKELNDRGITRVSIVAHSMGCLVTTYYLAYGEQEPDQAKLSWAGAERVHKVAMMAGPFEGAFSVFRNMQTGAPFSLNSKILPGEAVASFHSSFQILPFKHFRFFDEKGNHGTFSLEDASQWQELKLGLLENQNIDEETKQKRFEFTDAQLKRAKKFAQLVRLEEAKPPHKLDVISVIGIGQKTTDSAYFDKKNRQFIFDTEKKKAPKVPDDLYYADGDGTVTRQSQELPKVLNDLSRNFITKKTHGVVFEDKEFAKALREFLK